MNTIDNIHEINHSHQARLKNKKYHSIYSK